MTREELISMAEKIGAKVDMLVTNPPTPYEIRFTSDGLQIFAWTYAAKELADCAQQLEDHLKTRHGLMEDETYRMAVTHCVRFLRQMSDVNSLTSLPGGLKGKGLKP